MTSYPTFAELAADKARADIRRLRPGETVTVNGHAVKRAPIDDAGGRPRYYARFQLFAGPDAARLAAEVVAGGRS